MNIRIFFGELLNKFNLDVSFLFPRESVKFSRNFFRGKKLTAVEIGSLKGEHALSILQNLNVEKLYIIDPYEDYKDYKEGRSQKSLSRAERECRRRLSPYLKKVVFIKKYSNDAVKEIPKEIDYIYIDGNHDYEFVRDDLKNYFPLVKLGGIVAGHDIQYKGVSDAVVEFSCKNKIKNLHIGDRRDWWMVKE